MQKVYLSKTQSGIYGLFTDNFLVMSLGKSLYDTVLNNKVEFKALCESQNFDPVYPKPEKIYFTVQTRLNTYYYESDSTDSLQVDIKNIAREIKVEDCQDIPIGLTTFKSITYANQLPKGILL